MDKLKPCPFCGSVNLAQDAALSDYIECRDCGAYGPDGSSEGWDTRAESPELTAANARIAELEETLEPFARIHVVATHDSDRVHIIPFEPWVTYADTRRSAALLEKSQ